MPKTRLVQCLRATSDGVVRKVNLSMLHHLFTAMLVNDGKALRRWMVASRVTFRDHERPRRSSLVEGCGCNDGHAAHLAHIVVLLVSTFPQDLLERLWLEAHSRIAAAETR